MKGGTRKRGNSWSYYFEIGKASNGKRKRKEKGGFKTKKDAETALTKAIYDFEQTGRIISESNISISQYMQYWYENHVLLNCRYRTQVEYKRIIEKNITPYLGHYYLKDLKPTTIKEFLDMHYKRNIAKRTLESIFNVLKHSLDMSVFPYEYIKDNPAKYIKLKYKFEQAKTNHITNQDALKVLSYLKENYYNYYIPFLIMYHTGCRKSEVLGLQWENIDLDNNIIQIRHQALYRDGQMLLVETKTPTSVADIFIGNTLVDELKVYKEISSYRKLTHNFVCINMNYAPMSIPNFGWIIRKINQDLDIKVKAHGFRHLHGQMLLDNNANIKGIQSRLRHSNIKTTLQTYLKSSNKIDNDIINLWEEIQF